MKFVSGGEGAAVAGTRDQMMHGFLFFHTDFGDGIAFGFLGVDSRIVIDLVLGVATDLCDGLDISHEGGVRGLEIVVGERVLAWPQLLLGAPALHKIFIQKGATGVVVETYFVLDRAVLMHLWFVRKNQLVTVLVVLEEIEDAALLHQARDKIECSFAILNNVFPLRVAALRAILKILKAMILKDFLDDFGDGLLLKNLAIGCAREEPEPGNNFSTIMAKAVVATYTSKAADKTVPMTLAIPSMVHRDGHLLADDVLVDYGVIFRQKFDGKTEEL